MPNKRKSPLEVAASKQAKISYDTQKDKIVICSVNREINQICNPITGCICCYNINDDKPVCKDFTFQQVSKPVYRVVNKLEQGRAS